MTDVTEKELMDLGRGLLNAITLTYNLGHVSPAESLRYIHGEDSTTYIIKDFIAWVSGQETLLPNCRERLVWLVNTSGWNTSLMDNIFGTALSKKEEKVS